MKKYNNQTGCYKIDIYINGVYKCSTDQSKSCKEAVKKYLLKYPTQDYVTAEFYEQ